MVIGHSRSLTLHVMGPQGTHFKKNITWRGLVQMVWILLRGSRVILIRGIQRVPNKRDREAHIRKVQGTHNGSVQAAHIRRVQRSHTGRVQRTCIRSVQRSTFGRSRGSHQEVKVAHIGSRGGHIRSRGPTSD